MAHTATRRHPTAGRRTGRAVIRRPSSYPVGRLRGDKLASTPSPRRKPGGCRTPCRRSCTEPQGHATAPHQAPRRTALRQQLGRTGAVVSHHARVADVLWAQELRGPLVIRAIWMVVPRDHNTRGGIGTHRSGKQIPVFRVGLELLEVRDLVLDTQASGVDVHPIRGISPRVPEQVPTAAFMHQFELHSTALRLGNLLRTTSPLDLSYLGGSVGGALRLGRRHFRRAFLPAAKPSRKDGDDQAQTRDHKRCDGHSRIQAPPDPAQRSHAAGRRTRCPRSHEPPGLGRRRVPELSSHCRWRIMSPAVRPLAEAKPTAVRDRPACPPSVFIASWGVWPHTGLRAGLSARHWTACTRRSAEARPSWLGTPARGRKATCAHTLPAAQPTFTKRRPPCRRTPQHTTSPTTAPHAGR